VSQTGAGRHILRRGHTPLTRVALSLLKPRYHLSYAAVVAAALLFGPTFDGSLAVRLVALYGSFTLLFYSGIYIFNDIADARTDAAHPRKRERPIASGRVAVRSAVIAATTLIAVGLLTATIFLPPAALGAYVVALALNAAYSSGGRNLPYLDIALNSAPHAIRFLMGVLLVGRTPPPGHLAAWFCLAAGVACVRRLVELEAGGARCRPSLTHYSARGLSLAADSGIVILLALCVLDGLRSPGFYLLAITAYLLLVMAARRIAVVQNRLAWLWLS
jgi:decaprenyl-phosphate phosphoribosyltransferase